MDKLLYIIFEHFSFATGIGVQVLSVRGEARYVSPLLAQHMETVDRLLDAVDCTAAERMSLIYSCYQARRSGGRYIFLGPSGLAYCTSPLFGEGGILEAEVVAGPFLMTDPDDYLEIDIFDRLKADRNKIEPLKVGIAALPYKSPVAARAVREHLFLCAAHSDWDIPPSVYPIQMDYLPYPLDKEDTFLDAVSKGDIQGAGGILNDILLQMLFHSGTDVKMLRSRVFELTVLLSRAAIKGNANIDAIFGLNYAYVREIDALSNLQDVVEWLHGLTRRFRQHVFAFAKSRNTSVIYKSIDYINSNYMYKITLQDMAGHVFLSPSYFSKLFKDETGQTPTSFLTGVRIDASKRLLLDPNLSIVDITEMAGFDNQSYFTRVFKKAEGQTPNQYRLRNRQ